MTAQDNKLIETNPPFGVIMGLGWGFFWRSTLWYLLFLFSLVIFLVTMFFVTGAVSSMEQLSKGPPAVSDAAAYAIWAVFVAFLILICSKALKGMLGKKFGGYRLVLLTPQAVAETDRAANAAAAGVISPPPSSASPQPPV